MLIIEDAKLEALANKLGTLPELTHTNIDKYLVECSIQDISTKSRSVGLGYITGDSKSKRIYKCFINEVHKTNNDLKIVSFIERALDPSRFADSKRYDDVLNDINSVLLFMGCEINKSGKVKIVKKATTIDEVQERINALENEAKKRNVHPEVLKYCKREYLDKDYFHAQFEVSKGLFQRIRDLTNQKCIGMGNRPNKEFPLDDKFIACIPKKQLKTIMNEIIQMFKNQMNSLSDNMKIED